MRNREVFKRFEVVQDIRFLDRPLQVGVELTNLAKLKRHVILQHYANLIDEMLDAQDD